MFSTKGVNPRLDLHFLMNSSQHSVRCSPLPFFCPLRAEKLIKHTLISAALLASCLRWPPHYPNLPFSRSTHTHTLARAHTHTYTRSQATSFTEPLHCSESNGLTSTIFLPGTGNHWTLVREPAIDVIHITELCPSPLPRPSPWQASPNSAPPSVSLTFLHHLYFLHCWNLLWASSA